MRIPDSSTGKIDLDVVDDEEETFLPGCSFGICDLNIWAFDCGFV